jgi:hypothetical protein
MEMGDTDAVITAQESCLSFSLKTARLKTGHRLKSKKLQNLNRLKSIALQNLMLVRKSGPIKMLGLVAINPCKDTLF